ncbi:MAG: type II secretion system protein GspN [Pseudomonadota bacterium]
MTRFRIRLFYTLYSLAAALFFLFLLFPGESVKKEITNRIEGIYPPYHLRIGRLKPSLPPGIQMSGLTLMDNNESLITVSKLNLIPKFFRLMRGQFSFRFEGDAHEGTFSGEMNCGKDNWTRAEQLSLRVAHLKIKEAALKVIEGAPVLSGILNGDLTYSQSEKGGDVTDATVSLKEITLGLPALSAQGGNIAFETVDAAFSIEKQTLTFRQFTFTGRQVEGNITGSVRLAEPAAKSQLNLRLEISIRPEYLDQLAQLIPLVLLQSHNNSQNSYKLRIFGKLDKPGFSITR